MEGSLLALAGWGLTHNHDAIKPDRWAILLDLARLQRTELPALSDAACRASYSDSHYWEWLKEDMLCAGDLVCFVLFILYSSSPRSPPAWAPATGTRAAA